MSYLPGLTTIDYSVVDISHTPEFMDLQKYVIDSNFEERVELERGPMAGFAIDTFANSNPEYVELQVKLVQSISSTNNILPVRSLLRGYDVNGKSKLMAHRDRSINTPSHGDMGSNYYQRLIGKVAAVPIIGTAVFDLWSLDAIYEDTFTFSPYEDDFDDKKHSSFRLVERIEQKPGQMIIIDESQTHKLVPFAHDRHIFHSVRAESTRISLIMRSLV
jgi:hypothetical protein